MLKGQINIRIICRNMAEKRALIKAAKKAGVTVSRFGLEAMHKSAGIEIRDRTCKLCPNLLNASNRSGVCRNCTRTAGTEALQRVA